MKKDDDRYRPFSIDKNLWEDFECLCEDEGLTFEEGMETPIEQAIDDWQITRWYDDDGDDDATIINDWKDINENVKR